MKILFLFNTRIAKHGSFEDLILLLAREISRRGDRCTFVFPKIEHDGFRQELAPFAAIHVVPGNWNGLPILGEFARILSRERPDLLNTHFCDSMSFGLLFAWARLLGVTTIYHYHGEILPLDELQWFKPYLNAIRLLTLPVTKIITVSAANERFLRRLSVVPPIEVIPNGIDLERFSRRPIPEGFWEAHGLRVGERYLIYIGSLIPRKRIDFLLRAFGLVQKQAAGVKLVIVGGGEVERFRAMARDLDLSHLVHFTELVRDYPHALLQEATLVVSASKQESFGLIFAEASALGVPAVACRVGGIPEVVPDGEVGLLADPDNVEDFAEKITRILGDEDLRLSLVTRGRSRVEERFSLSTTVHDILASFERACKAERRSRMLRGQSV